MTAQLLVLADPKSYAPPNALVVPISSHIRTKRELFGVMKKHLRLPSYFGNNWDALNDCLRDGSWLTGVDEIVLRHDSKPFGEGSGHRALYRELLIGLIAEPPEGPPKVTVVISEAIRGWLIAESV